MSGITGKDKEYIEKLFDPTNQLIEQLHLRQSELQIQQQKFLEHQIEIIKDQASIKSELVILNKTVNGNGSEGLIEVINSHIQWHKNENEDIKKRNEIKKDRAELIERDNKKLRYTIIIGILSTGAMTAIVNFLLSLI